ncbi:hypothetical protein IWQ60_001753 [Tieghemiomyces parasiticus]|uniref:Altered inheritance of mitochondria protein 24, mitochondrial n=1 Tax=Tieghemiomyces parasiticus TaxID=78921 RepID=A0A9W8AG24_9FUNG|nr:hypothetical protein IWQ60_001753 [Tieghemiomyces parasiticus]
MLRHAITTAARTPLRGIQLHIPTLGRRSVSISLGDANNGQSRATLGPWSADRPTPQPGSPAPSSATTATPADGTSTPVQTISRWAVGLHSILPKSQKPPPPAPPVLEILSSGHGAMVLARLPPHSRLLAVPNTVMGHSPTTHMTTVTGSVLRLGTSSPLRRGLRFRHTRLTTSQEPGDVLLAAQGQGDVAILALKGTADYVVRPSALTALSSEVRVGLAGGKHGVVGPASRLFRHLSGSGSAVISATGGVYRLVLNPGESYVINPRYLLAWDAGLQFQPSNSAAERQSATRSPSSDSAAQTSTSSSTSTAPPRWWRFSLPALYRQIMRQAVGRDTLLPSVVAPYVSDYVVRPLRFVVDLAGGWVRGIAGRVFVTYPSYQVTGPGDLYIATRLPANWLIKQSRFSVPSQEP